MPPGVLLFLDLPSLSRVLDYTIVSTKNTILFSLKLLITYEGYALFLGLILAGLAHATYCVVAPNQELHITAKFTGFCNIEAPSVLRNTSSAWQK